MKRKYAFETMDKERLKEITSKGGKSAHAKGVAHEFTAAEAKIIGQRGGRALAQDRAHMREIGQKGGRNRVLKRGYRLRSEPKSAEVIALEDRLFSPEE